MRVSQAHISKSLDGLQDNFRRKYGLSEYLHKDRPLVIFGMYDADDLSVYLNHPSDVVVVWQGCDGRDAHLIAEDIKKRKAKHYSISHWIKNSLDDLGIENTFAPISATIVPESIEIPKRGTHIYYYSSDLSKESGDYYGDYMLEEIERRTGLHVIRTTINTLKKDQLLKVYSLCFVNLRLTTYDGCPNTNLEIGMLGRRSIYNGDLPHSIKWNNVDDICDSIISEYERRNEDNSQIAIDIVSFINLPNNIFKL